jgi:RNA polymerase sigma factor (TIGR02999 family)
MDDAAALTELIQRALRGDGDAADAVFAATYGELRQMARARLRRGGRNTLLDTTALVHEWYVRFARARQIQLKDRGHFMRYAGRAMRTIIVDFARRRRSQRRGGSAARETLDPERVGIAADEEILAVHQALESLSGVSPRMAEVVELRYFGGLSEVETAEALGLSDRTVRREWDKARLWLAQALKPSS